MKNIFETAKNLGEGDIRTTSSGKKAFCLSDFAGNPIIKPKEIGLNWQSNGEEMVGAVFNGGAELIDNKIVILPRCQQNYGRESYVDPENGLLRYRLTDYISEVWPLISEDGINFERYKDGAIKGDGSDHEDFLYGIEDIRCVKVGDKYILTGCGKLKPPFGGSDADRVAIYSTEDFIDIKYHGMVDSFDTRNSYLLSGNTDGKLYIFTRFHPNTYLQPLEGGLDQLLNPDDYKEEWQKIFSDREENLLMKNGDFAHENEKVGPGSQIIPTDDGLLFIYHAVGTIGTDIGEIYGLEEPIERGYSICACLLDKDDPQKIICRTETPIYIPSKPWELNGSEEYPVDIPAVVFPVGSIVVEDKLLIYAGATDKYTIILSCKLDKLVKYLLDYCKR